MEWQQIVGFHHAARLKSFTRAAEATLRTQSALSQQIKAIEEEFGCLLFNRIGTRKLKLTPAGERFFDFCDAVLKGYRDLAIDLDELKGSRKGRLRIAAPFTTLYHLFPRKLKGYLALFPQVEFILLDRPQRVVVELVKSGEVDFGLAMESIVPGDLVSMRYEKVETVLMAPRSHPLAGKKRVSWREIAKYPLILPPRELRHAGRSMLEEQLGKLGLECRIVMESSNIELSSVYVEMGLGISLATIVRDLPALKDRNLEFISLSHFFKPDHVALVMRKGKHIASVEQGFIEALLD